MLPMQEFKNTSEILEFAINMEEQSIKFYNTLAKNATSAIMKPIFIELANEEVKHRNKLLKINANNFSFSKGAHVEDLHIDDYIHPKVQYESLKYTELLVIAMSRERRSFMLYEKLAFMVEDNELKKVFQYLADEESQHRHRFEVEYDDFVFAEN